MAPDQFKRRHYGMDKTGRASRSLSLINTHTRTHTCRHTRTHAHTSTTLIHVFAGVYRFVFLSHKYRYIVYVYRTKTACWYKEAFLTVPSSKWLKWTGPSGAAALLHDHVGHVPLDDVVLVVKVEHGHGAELGGDAAGVDRARAHPPEAVLVDDRRVEGRS